MGSGVIRVRAWALVALTSKAQPPVLGKQKEIVKSAERRLFIQCVHWEEKQIRGSITTPTAPPILTYIDQALSLAPVYDLMHSSSAWDQASASPLPQCGSQEIPSPCTLLF